MNLFHMFDKIKKQKMNLKFICLVMFLIEKIEKKEKLFLIYISVCINLFTGTPVTVEAKVAEDESLASNLVKLYNVATASTSL